MKFALAAFLALVLSVAIPLAVWLLTTLGNKSDHTWIPLGGVAVWCLSMVALIGVGLL